MRIRLTLAFTAVMAVVLLAVGLFVYARVGSDLDAALDNSLRSRADDIAAVAGGAGLGVGRPGPARRERREPRAGDRARRQRCSYSSAGLGERAPARSDELARARRGPIFVDRDSVAGFDERVRLLARPTDTA